MYLTLEQVKKHLLVDEDFKADDLYILDLITVAEDSVSKHLDIALEELEEDGYIGKTKKEVKEQTNEIEISNTKFILIVLAIIAMIVGVIVMIVKNGWKPMEVYIEQKPYKKLKGYQMNPSSSPHMS